MRKSTLVIGTLLVANIAVSSVTLTQVNAQLADDSNPAVELSANDKPSGGAVIATYDGNNITEGQLRPYLAELVSTDQFNAWGGVESAPVEAIQAAINNMIIDETLMERAKSAKIDQDQELQAELDKNRRQAIKNAYLKSISPALVTEQQIRQEYEKLRASLEGKTEYRARHILLGSKKEADIVNKALRDEKRPFSELAKLFSLDEATALRGGDLGYQLQGQLNADFEKAISKLKIDEISAPFETSLGWHIAVVDDRRESKAMPFEEASPIIRRKLEQQAIKNYLTDILVKAEVNVVLEQPSQDSVTDETSPAEDGNKN